MVLAGNEKTSAGVQNTEIYFINAIEVLSHMMAYLQKQEWVSHSALGCGFSLILISGKMLLEVRDRGQGNPNLKGLNRSVLFRSYLKYMKHISLLSC